MSLKLRQAIPGRPRRSASALASVATAKGAYFVYPSASNVVLLDPDGDLHATLPFWDALPHRAGPSADREVVGVCARGDVIVAWSGTHVVLWRKGEDSEWSVHSNIVAGGLISSLDYRSGSVAVGTEAGVEVWRTELDEEVVVWDRVWTTRTDASPNVSLPPEKNHVAWYFKDGKVVTVQAVSRTGAAGPPQEIKQPREVEWIGWRSVKTGDAQLYVVTTNVVLRIYAPVLDDPSWFQLLYSMDARAFRDAGQLPTKGKDAADRGAIFVPDAEVVKRAAASAAAAAKRNGKTIPPATLKVLEAVDQDELDLALWFGQDGRVRVRSITNLDRAPPTLIKSEQIAAFTADVEAAWSSYGALLQGEATDALLLGFPPSEERKEISTLRLNLVDLLASVDSSVQFANAAVDFETVPVMMTSDIKGFVRTPNGRGLLAIGEGGEIGVWEKRRLGKIAQAGKAHSAALVGKGQWMAPAVPILYAIYAKGRGIASYYNDKERGPRVVLQHLDPGDSKPTEPVVMPHFEPKENDTIKLLLALSDIDDGYSARKKRTRRAIIMVVAESGEAWVWRIEPAPTSPRAEFAQSPFSTPAKKPSRLPSSSPDRPLRRRESSLSGVSVYHSEKPIVTLISHSKLPVEDGKKPRFILPVDPMGWHSSTVDWETDTPLQDMVVTLSEAGVLEFWRPRLGQHLIGEHRTDIGDAACDGNQSAAWTRSGIVRTEKTNVSIARCSSRKKTVLISELEDGQNEMTIWDSNVSEFSTGMELSHAFEKGFTVQDLDWTTTADLQSVLAVGFPHHVVLVCEQRLSYVDVTPGWAPFLHIDMRKYTSVPISDSVWIAGGSLAVGAGNQIYVFSRFISEHTPPGTPVEEDADPDEPEDIFELIAHRNGPLFDFHPTLLNQCLLWDKIDLVKRILITLVKDLRKDEYEGKRRLTYQRLDPLVFHESNSSAPQVKAAKADYSSLFSITPTVSSEVDDDFNPSLVQELVDRLDGPVIIPLTQLEKSTLAALAQATLEVEESRRSLDLCGLRYLISIRQFANRDRIVATPGTGTPEKPRDLDLPNMPLPKAKISFRNIVWATHSESDQVLLQSATASCENNKMTIDDAKRLGVFLWLRSQDDIRNQLEAVARNRFMAQEERDPTTVSLIFFALGKKQVVHGLWRQAPGHREQSMMLKFLNNDFTTERWKTAALKNAYALLSKQRYEYAAAFFMLGGKTKDAITVCLRQLGDWQLAVALARAVEGDGPLLQWILSDTVLPIAFGGGHRWLASWTLWMLGRRDLSVRVLVSPMEEIATAWDENWSDQVGQPDNDDPSLLLLFQHLKSKTLQTAKGTSEVSPKLEFDFVLHNARIFCRMGCHPLGLDLLRSWSFERPWFPPPKTRPPPLKLENGTPSTGATSPRIPLSSPFTVRRRSSFMLSRPAGRDTMTMDMDVVAEGGTEPPTRASSPPPANNLFGSYDIGKGSPETERKGNLMKELRNDVQQGSAAFDMDTFFGPGSGDKSTSAKQPDEHDSLKTAVKFNPNFSMESYFPTTSPESASGVSTPRDGLPPHKGANLMKEAATNSMQGGAEFRMDNFGLGLQGVSPGSGTPVSRGAKRDVQRGADGANGTPGTEKASGTSTPSASKKGANLMKAHASDAAQGAADFDMGSFDFAPKPATKSAKDHAAPAPAKDVDTQSTATTADAKVEEPTATQTSEESPTEKDKEQPPKGEAKPDDQPRKVGNLMKDVKSDSGQGAADFDMSAFGF